MKLLIKTAFFHVLCIFIFALIYYYLYNEFKNVNNQKKNFMDFLLLSTTIQAGVGVTVLLPTEFYSKFFVISHQILRIFTHIITMYIFTL